MADRQLLGALNKDHKYLQQLIRNPRLKSTYHIVDETTHPTGKLTQMKIIETAQEGIDFLERRKTFWQQQEPVFARKFRTSKGTVTLL